MKEQRQATIRRDLNDLVRDDSGHLSPTKIGILLGQWLAIKMILEHGSEIIANWDSLTVLFSVLIAPEIFKKWLLIKWGNGNSVTTDERTHTKTVTKGKSAKGAG